MIRLAVAATLLLSACTSATPVTNVGVSLSPNGLNVSPSVGLYGTNATLVFHP